ncbi:MAG: hypothetical protein DRO18_04390 [Thermoprotei archaeon]|nr:MAG: hypothetical protein DRO18_04390 [Thermoprotei archaeon]
MEFDLKKLRFNPAPPSIKEGRKFSKSPMEVFLKIEDILSHYALGNIDYEHAIKALNYARNAIIPKLSYNKDVKEGLIRAYDEAIKLLTKLKSRERVKEWLLSNGPPRRIVTLTDFMKN